MALHKTDLYRIHLRHLPQAVQAQYLREVRTVLMATPTARERVDAAGVLYVLPEREVAITFAGEAYHLVETKPARDQ